VYPPPSVNWNDLAAALKLEERSDVMPYTFNCCLCQSPESMTIYQNTINDTGWYYCKACGQNGDLFSFAASYLKMSIDAAIVELTKRGLPTLIGLTPPVIVSYKANAKFNAKANIGWSRCRDYLIKPTTAVNELLVLFNLQFKKWENFEPRPERYVGAVHVRDLEKELGTQFKHYKNAVKSNKVYEQTDTLPIRFQKGWGDVLVLPFENAPGLISGFLCVGYRHGKLQRQFTRIRITNNTFGVKQKNIDSGLWGLYASTHCKSTYSNYAIALEDPLLALRIQSRHALMSKKPLPIVSWLFEETESTQGISWASVVQKNIVIVATKLTPSVLHAAYTSGGLLTILDTTEAGFLELIKNRKPEDLIKDFIRRALPWRDMVRRWLTTVSTNVATELFNLLELHSKNAQEIRKEFEDLLADVSSSVKIKYCRILLKKDFVNVIENNDGWYFQYTSSYCVQATNFILRINSMSSIKKNRECDATILFKNEVIPVTFNRAQILHEKETERKIIEVFIEHGLGYPKINTGSISLLKIASMFKTPKFYVFPELFSNRSIQSDPN